MVVLVMMPTYRTGQIWGIRDTQGKFKLSPRQLLGTGVTEADLAKQLSVVLQGTVKPSEHIPPSRRNSAPLTPRAPSRA